MQLGMVALTLKLGVVLYTCNLSYLGGRGRIVLLKTAWSTQQVCLKIKCEKGWRCISVVQVLPNMHKALGFNYGVGGKEEKGMVGRRRRIRGSFNSLQNLVS